MDMKYYEDLYGNRRVNIRLATLAYIKDLMEKKQFDEAFLLIETACAADERRQLREVREEVWQRLQKARAAGDKQQIKEMQKLLRQVEEAKKGFRV